jgi:hypothetical protein
MFHQYCFEVVNYNEDLQDDNCPFGGVINVFNGNF